MKIDQDYLKRMVNVFQDSEAHYTTLSEFESAGFQLDDKFLFHFQRLEDEVLIKAYNEDNFLGYHVSLGGNVQWVGQNLRLTAAGHEFADSLNKIEIFEILSNEFKTASASTLVTVSKELMIAFAKNQAKKYFDS